MMLEGYRIVLFALAAVILPILVIMGFAGWLLSYVGHRHHASDTLRRPHYPSSKKSTRRKRT